MILFKIEIYTYIRIAILNSKFELYTTRRRFEYSDYNTPVHKRQDPHSWVIMGAFMGPTNGLWVALGFAEVYLNIGGLFQWRLEAMALAVAAFRLAQLSKLATSSSGTYSDLDVLF